MSNHPTQTLPMDFVSGKTHIQERPPSPLEKKEEDPMTNETRVVAECFSREDIVSEMYGRNKSGLNAWEIHVVDKYFKRRPALILDIGCGTGREAFALSEIGFNVIGIDLSEKEIDIADAEAKKLNRDIVFEVGSGLDLGYQNATFDFIVMWAQAFGNVYGPQNQKKLLSECHRTLKAAGYLCFSGHSYGYVTSNYPHYVDGKKFYAYANTECYWELFTLEEMKALSLESGFRVVECCNSVELGSEIEKQVLVCVVQK